MQLTRLGALALLPSYVAYAKHVDVAIVGGGLSGLAAAKDLAKGGKSFAVLEARDRLGGRVLNAQLPDGGVEELGAEFIGPTQDRVYALAEELGLETHATYIKGNSIFYRNGKAVEFDGSNTSAPFPVNEGALLEIAGFIKQIDEWAAELDTSAPWEHEQAREWDSLNLQSYLDRTMTEPDAKFLVEAAIHSVFSTEMNELSLLYTIAYVAGAGNETLPGTLERLIGTSGGAQEDRIVGGTQLLATDLAKKLGKRNIHLNAPVRKITRKGDRYHVEAENVRLTATHVVVAMSPPLASRIIYDPPLPAGRDQLTQRMPMGSIAKAMAIYSEPWWRADGLNAQVLSDTGVVRTTFDSSPANSPVGAIMGFIEADQAREMDQLSEDEVKELVVEDMVRFFGDKAANPTEVLLQRWDLEVFSRGGPVAYGPPGVLTQLGKFIGAPFEGIHFAGTETAEYWTGYMDGAVRSGERVAKEILGS